MYRWGGDGDRAVLRLLGDRPFCLRKLGRGNRSDGLRSKGRAQPRKTCGLGRLNRRAKSNLSPFQSRGDPRQEKRVGPLCIMTPRRCLRRFWGEKRTQEQVASGDHWSLTLPPLDPPLNSTIVEKYKSGFYMGGSLLVVWRRSC